MGLLIFVRKQYNCWLRGTWMKVEGFADGQKYELYFWVAVMNDLKKVQFVGAPIGDGKSNFFSTNEIALKLLIRVNRSADRTVLLHSSPTCVRTLVRHGYHLVRHGYLLVYGTTLNPVAWNRTNTLYWSRIGYLARTVTRFPHYRHAGDVQTLHNTLSLHDSSAPIKIPLNWPSLTWSCKWQWNISRSRTIWSVCSVSPFELQCDHPVWLTSSVCLSVFFSSVLSRHSEDFRGYLKYWR